MLKGNEVPYLYNRRGHSYLLFLQIVLNYGGVHGYKIKRIDGAACIVGT